MSLTHRASVGAAVFAAIVVGTPATARADDKQACGAAYEQTQSQRKAGKLAAARQQAALCTRDACAEFIRADCARWLGEMEASQPTVVFEVRDTAGKETSAVRVDLDGKPWVAALDGQARPIDPGQHTLHYALGSGESVDDSVQIREGEKNRRLTATFQKGGAAQAAAPPDDGQRSVAPWVIGGVGVAALVVGGVLAGLVAKDRSTTEDPTQCNQTTLKCTASGLSAANQGKLLGSVSTAMFVAGGAAVGAGVVWLVVRGPAKSAAPIASLGMGAVVTASGPAWRLSGSW
jgi:hypothetical protein